MILETERLLLREFQEADFEAVHEYATDPEVVRYLEWGPNTERDTRDYLQRQSAQQSQRPRRDYDFALVLRSGGRVIGSCGIHVIQPEHKEAFIGYVLNRSYWNKGYMTEAVKRVLQFGFGELQMHRIYATCDPANMASARVMSKNGMALEGRLREHKLAKGKWRDSLQYSILEQEASIT